MNETKPFVVGLEEHWAHPDVSAERQFVNIPVLLDLGEKRLEKMDEAGIDVKVLSHTLWRDGLNAETEVELAIRANDHLKAAVDANPKRFRGFASIPMIDAAAGADELERAVTRLGFVGGMIFPINDGEFLDQQRFWPVFEAGTCAFRLVLSRIFDTYPNLRIILGHLGEFIPFGLDRIEERIDNARGGHFPFREYFCEHFWVTTSGFFSTPALLCTIMAIGIDRVMFSIDWPMNDAGPAMRWMENLPLSAEDKAKIYSGNARRLLKI